MKVCYISLTGYGLFDEKYAEKCAYGGAEVAMHTDAHELAKDKEFDVHVLAHADKEQHLKKNNLTLWTFEGEPTNNVYQYAQYCRKLWAKLGEINADLYVYRAAPGEIYFLLAMFCKMHWKKCVHALGIAPPRKLHTFKPIRYLRWVLLLQTGLQLADKIVALAYDQIPKLRPSLRRKTSVIYTGKKILSNKTPKRKHFLWVGRDRPEKRPEILKQLAEQLPKEKFIMIGMNEKMPKNVQCIKEVSNSRMKKYYSQAIATISTSAYEGFSNVYLESWNNGTPVIALTVDTDEAICRHNLGVHSRTFEQLVKDVKKARNNWKTQSRNAIAYIRKNHDLSRQIEEYKRLFRGLK